MDGTPRGVRLQLADCSLDYSLGLIAGCLFHHNLVAHGKKIARVGPVDAHQTLCERGL